MPRYFEHPDYGLPIAGLKRSNYVLFKNGEIWEKVDGDDENRHYLDVYTSTQPVEIELKDADNISDNVKKLNEPLTIIGYTVFLGMLYYVLQSQSWSILDSIIDAQLGVWGLVVGLFLWIVISTFPRLVYELLKGDLNDAQYILVKFIRRPNSPVEIHQGKGWRKELALVFAYVQSVSVTLALLIYSPESIDTSAFMTVAITILGMNAIAGALLIPIIPNLVIIGRFDGKLEKIEQMSLIQFFNKTKESIDSYKESDQGSLEERILGGETNSLEFKETYWTETKGENIGQRNKGLQDVIVKVVAGFLNTSGGALLIGISDDKQVSDYLEIDCTHSKSVTDLDKLIDVIDQYLSENLECAFKQTGVLSQYWVTKLKTVHSKQIIQIEIKKAPGPVLAFQKREQRKKKNLSNNPEEIDENRKFKFLRIGSSTRERSQDTWENHIFTNWK
tara:strand:- start:203 stop:1543 length:1341 start_codon:yes stop_codon:yes gene_type:complete